MTIQVLKTQGYAIQSIANQTGVSRNTVKKYLNQKASCEPTYKARASKASKLAPYKPYLQRRIQAASPDWIPAAVLFPRDS